ncbi:MAG: GH92 family glycosyl hydrolase [Saprospiraceae bacterium]|nr:GH92 family glycosyl hydrolase [Saprospiraceae bacterium]
MKNNILPFFPLFSLFIFLQNIALCQKSAPTDYVNPFIGTAAHGHVFLGANVPFGMIQAGPNNILKGWDWCSGYHFSSKEILGFSHLHLSGTGIGDWGDILLLPASDSVIISAAKKDDLSDGYGSPYSHQNEQCSPGYYKVYLDRYHNTTEITTTSRTAMHRYHYEKGVQNPHILVDLRFGIGWDAPTSTSIKRLDDSTLVGYRFSKGWAKDQRVYFAIRLKDHSTRTIFFSDDTPNKDTFACALFPNLTSDGEVKLKVALSPVSYQNAILNLNREMPGWDFEYYHNAAVRKWNNELSVIDYQANDKLKTIFYTALYHSFFFPSVFDDVNGEYRGSDLKIHQGKAGTNFTVFSLWDTYRAQHPMLTLLKPNMVKNLVRSMLNIYKEQGKLPVWHLSGNETNTMVGYSAVPVVVDAWNKGIAGSDSGLIYQAIKQSSMQKNNGIAYLHNLGYIPADSVVESVAKALEYAISDGCIALMADKVGTSVENDYYTQRSKLYRLYFDKENRFMRGRMANGDWRSPFNPFEARHRVNDYCEGNAWQYTWLVPQDVDGLIDLMGGKEKFAVKLDSFFIATGDMGAEASPDISGLIGQYAHGNEPGHHIPYLYNYVDQPKKTQKLVRRIMDEMYTDKPEGLCGNEDVGQMSAWYILSALGFYQVHPSDGIFQIGSPRMDSARINLPGGKNFSIRVKRSKATDCVIYSIKLNGKSYPFTSIPYSEIMKGGVMEIQMKGD